MEEVEEKLNIWLSAHPQSGHPLDLERYCNFIDAVVAYKGYLGPDWFRHELETREHPLDEQQVNRLVAQFDVIVDYGKHAHINSQSRD